MSTNNSKSFTKRVFDAGANTKEHKYTLKSKDASTNETSQVVFSGAIEDTSDLNEIAFRASKGAKVSYSRKYDDSDSLSATAESSGAKAARCVLMMRLKREVSDDEVAAALARFAPPAPETNGAPPDRNEALEEALNGAKKKKAPATT